MTVSNTSCTAQGGSGGVLDVDLADALLQFTNYVMNERVRCYNEGVASSQARIRELATLLQSAQRIIERDFPNGQLAIDIRAALSREDAP